MSRPRLVRSDAPYTLVSHPTPSDALFPTMTDADTVSRDALASRRNALRAMARAILYGGLAAGILDIAAALAQTSLRGSTPIRLFQAIASGILGRASYDGGLATAALGLVSHFMIAFGAATVFVLVAWRVPFLVSVTWLSGPVFGMLVWAMMRFVVLPLSAYPHVQNVDPRQMTTAVLIHVFCVGLPIALAARVIPISRRTSR